MLPVCAVDAFAKPAPPPAASGHSRSAHAHGHAGHALHGRPASAPAGETRNRPGRGPENDVKVDADDGGGPAQAQGAPQANAAPEHGTTGVRSPRKSRRSAPSRSARKPASRPGTGADSGFADADDPALPAEAAAAIKEADELQHTAQQATRPRNTAPQAPAPVGAPGVAPAAPAAPRGPVRARPANQTTDQSTNQTSNHRAARVKAPRSMPVAFFNANSAKGSRLVLHTNVGTSPEHTVTLQCDPSGGTHPKAAEACADVAKAGGDLAQMPANKNPRACFMIYAPVKVTAQGQWKGQPVRFTEKFPNTCVMRDKTGSVFDF